MTGTTIKVTTRTGAGSMSTLGPRAMAYLAGVCVLIQRGEYDDAKRTAEQVVLGHDPRNYRGPLTYAPRQE